MASKLRKLTKKYVFFISSLKFYTNKISAAGDGGSRSQPFARLTLCTSPHRHQRKFLLHTGGWGQQKFKNFQLNFLAISDNSTHFFVFLGSAPFFVLFFCELKLMQNLKTIGQPLLGEVAKKRKEKESQK